MPRGARVQKPAAFYETSNPNLNPKPNRPLTHTDQLQPLSSTGFPNQQVRQVAQAKAAAWIESKVESGVLSGSIDGWDGDLASGFADILGLNNRNPQSTQTDKWRDRAKQKPHADV